MNSDIKQFLIMSMVIPTLLFITVISPVNVFGFDEVSEKFTHVKEMKKDQSSFETINTFTPINNHTQTAQLNETDQMININLRWEPYNSFLGDDF